MKKLNDYTVLFLALGTAVFFVYFLPAALNRVLFFIFIYLFYKSDRDYLWIAFIFIILERPGSLFTGGELTEETRLPIYNIASGFSVTFQQIFVITAFFKAIKKNLRFKPLNFIKNKLLMLLFYFFFLIFIGIIIGFDMEVAGNIYYILINLTLFYSVYCLFANENDYINLYKILIPFGFVAFGLQLFSISSGLPLVKTINPETERYFGSYNFSIDNVRPVEMPTLILLLYFSSMYFLLHRKKYFNRNLLITLIIICFFSIMMNATRSWFIMIIMFIIFCFIFMSAKMGNMIVRYSLAGVISLIILFSADLFVNQLGRALARLSTIQLVAEGDITGGGTIGRYDVRAPAVMEAFYNESTIVFGAGFSKLYFEKGDGHVGFHNLLFNTGFVGMVLFAVFFGSIILNTFKINHELMFNNPYKDVLKIFPIAIVSIMFVNTGTQFIGYDVVLNRMFLFIFILFFLNNQISCAMKWEEESQ